MAVTSVAVSVTTSATLLGDARTLQFTPPSVIFVGGPGVTTSNGYALTAGVEYTYDLPNDCALYGVASGTVVVPVLRIDEIS